MLNSTARSSYSRVTCGSPSHKIAVLSPRPFSICTSRQLYETLIFPPTNHFELGTFHSSTRSHFLNQLSASACLPQNSSGRSIDSRWSLSYSARDLMRALAENSGDGGKTRFSCIVDEIACSVVAWAMRVKPPRVTLHCDNCP